MSSWCLAEWQKVRDLFLEEQFFLRRLVAYGVALIGGGLLIFLWRAHILPLSLEYFLFFTLILFLFGVARARVLFWLTVFFAHFELVTVFVWQGVELKVFQWFVLVLGAVTLWYWLQKKITFPRFVWAEWGLVVWLLLTVVSALVHQSGYKEALVLGFYFCAYGVLRFWLRSKKDLTQALSAFVLGALVVAVYAVWQLWAFEHGREALLVMAGRPNSVLPEADWLGLAMALAGLTTLWLGMHRGKKIVTLGWLVLSSIFVWVLVLSVGRSAWVAFGLGWILLASLGYWRQGSMFLRVQFWKVIVPLCLAFGLTICIPLSRFDISDRAVSSTGKQEITVSCEASIVPPQFIETLDHLPAGCRHIFLEEQSEEIQKGMNVVAIERNDPNVHIRRDIYKKALGVIKSHPWLGIGPGQSAQVFGVDTRGASLNSSNLLLEVLLMSGIGGAIGFLVFVGYTFWTGVVLWLRDPKTYSSAEVWVVLIITAGVFNMFNAGTLLAVMWFLFAFGTSVALKKTEK